MTGNPAEAPAVEHLFMVLVGTEYRLLSSYGEETVPLDVSEAMALVQGDLSTTNPELFVDTTSGFAIAGCYLPIRVDSRTGAIFAHLVKGAPRGATSRLRRTYRAAGGLRRAASEWYASDRSLHAGIRRAKELTELYEATQDEPTDPEGLVLPPTHLMEGPSSEGDADARAASLEVLASEVASLGRSIRRALRIGISLLAGLTVATAINTGLLLSQQFGAENDTQQSRAAAVSERSAPGEDVASTPPRATAPNVLRPVVAPAAHPVAGGEGAEEMVNAHPEPEPPPVVPFCASFRVDVKVSPDAPGLAERLSMEGLDKPNLCGWLEVDAGSAETTKEVLATRSARYHVDGVPFFARHRCIRLDGDEEAVLTIQHCGPSDPPFTISKHAFGVAESRLTMRSDSGSTATVVVLGRSQ